VSNGKLYADPECINPVRVLRWAGVVPVHDYGKTRDELYRIS